MNPDVLLNRIRLEQRGLIDIHKKLYEMEHLLPAPDPMQFAKTAESAALLSEKSTAHLRNMFFSVSNEPPIYYYPKAAEVQGIRVWADTNYLCVLLPALLPDKKKRDGCKFLLLPLQAALVQSGPLPHFSDCVICVEHIYEHFYFLTNDYNGETLLWLLCHPEIIGQLNAMLLQELQPPCRNAFIENDARTDAGAPILFCYLPDLPRLFRFLSALELLQMKGAILCFDFQADALRSLCGDRVEVQTIDFAEFERRFLTSP